MSDVPARRNSLTDAGRRASTERLSESLRRTSLGGGERSPERSPERRPSVTGSPSRRVSRVQLYPGEVVTCTPPGSLQAYTYFKFSGKEKRASCYAGRKFGSPEGHFFIVKAGTTAAATHLEGLEFAFIQIVTPQFGVVQLVTTPMAAGSLDPRTIGLLRTRVGTYATAPGRVGNKGRVVGVVNGLHYVFDVLDGTVDVEDAEGEGDAKKDRQF